MTRSEIAKRENLIQAAWSQAKMLQSMARNCYIFILQSTDNNKIIRWQDAIRKYNAEMARWMERLR